MGARFSQQEMMQALDPVGVERLGLDQAGEALCGVSTDSRSLSAQQIFVALDGPRFEGWDYCRNAVEAGAKALVVRRGYRQRSEFAELAKVASIYETDDTRKALGLLAKNWRMRLKAKALAVTGSNGKTTVKSMLASILQGEGATVASPESYNNEIGVPLTILSAGEETEYLVQECGMNHSGEIAALCEILRPNVGVVTNVGRAHLGQLGSLDAVAKAKGELYDHLEANGGVKAVPLDDPRLAARAAIVGAQRALTFGREAGDVRYWEKPNDGWSATVGFRFPDGAEAEASISVPGATVAPNAAAAAACAWSVGVSAESIVRGLETFAGASMRFDLYREPDGTVIVNDAYNANPDSMRAAIEAFAALPIEGARFCLFGDMEELGDAAEDFHREAGERAGRSGVDDLMSIGRFARWTVSGFRAGAGDESVGVVAESDEEVADWAIRRVAPGDGLLIKGSRSSRMERFCQAVPGGAE